MRKLTVLLATIALAWGPSPSLAAEGSSIAGPIGGTDIRSAQLPPPGLYGGLLYGHSQAYDFFDRHGNPIAALDALDLTVDVGGPFLLYVPNIQPLGGSVGVASFLPIGDRCGRVFDTNPEDCVAGLGDFYVEADWSRFFGTIRPSRYAGAPPIAEGLTVALGVGALVPTGTYDVDRAMTEGLAVGNNIWDFAPSIAVTYMTRPILAEGTEFSAKLYWNNYVENPDTDYWTGDLINIDFAVSERIGKFQVGVAGVYGFQVEDDELAGVPVEPDGRRAEGLSLGGVLIYDIPEHAASLKLKTLTTIITHNTPWSSAVVIGLAKKF